MGQIGRGIVWNLLARENFPFAEYLPAPELMEAICYAHDLGHPPYGHGGERALFRNMREFGGFEGNAQTIRILTKLEKYYRGNGILPTRRLLLGVLKYPVAYGRYEIGEGDNKPPKCFYDEDMPLIEAALSIFSPNDTEKFTSIGRDGKPIYKTLDCSVMELADDIAYGVHDLEDGVGRGILKRAEIEDDLLDGFRRAGVSHVRNLTIQELLDKLFSSDACERKHAVSLLVGFFILAIEVSRLNTFESGFLDLQATVQPEISRLLKHLSKEITFKSLVSRREVQTLEFKGEKVIDGLFSAFDERPVQLVGSEAFDQIEPGLSNLISDKNGNWRDLETPYRLKAARTICDFIAGMTNPYAEKYYRRLYEPGYGSSTDEL
ncbi:dNTP triphosphohydrolase [Rhizobium sp. MC63]|uniref:DNTP triphosphohydrolase n=1 Tax=Rhizobium mulingense TaxID=3031128 RepID=A0ACC6MVR5_9HYPH|nr:MULTISPECIES: dNTP triphosphohydrolase [unclassified Rhizobium]MDF0695172.1 dNTP triphosphohydrolase [Rhizobium sp. MC63]MEA3517464.1 dNTP triphosphohydrolase [Rhizobium sp. MJ31]MEB3045635.1 dNTP triphosphohydrolase [Rhizobium sp. MJ21]